jgi:hypothetical protein
MSLRVPGIALAIVGIGLLLAGFVLLEKNRPEQFDAAQSEITAFGGRDDIGNLLGLKERNQLHERKRREGREFMIWGAACLVLLGSCVGASRYLRVVGARRVDSSGPSAQSVPAELLGGGIGSLALIGGLVGFLLRPSNPIVGQLPLVTVLTRGSSLTGLDSLLVPLAERSFKYVAAGTVVGLLVGAAALPRLLQQTLDHYLTGVDDREKALDTLVEHSLKAVMVVCVIAGLIFLVFTLTEEA